MQNPIRRAFCALVPFCLTSLARADITYTLQFDPASSSQAQQVANSVAVAAAFYNQHGSFNKHWNVYYNSGIPTAEAGYNGYMGFGGARNERVVFHEAAHTFGMGTHGAYPGLVSGGWKGKYGNTALAESYGGTALAGDGHAIWPGGFNYDNEDGYLNRFYHTRVMSGIRADMGILSFTREARNEAVVQGETAEFRVESPAASSFQWQKDGAALVDGGRISGANSAILRIAETGAADAGSYRCVVTGAGETLGSRPRQLWVQPTRQLGQWNFDGNVNDSLNSQHGTAYGSPAYASGTTGLAVDLDGADDYIDLPDAIGRARDFTIATWVNWDGGGDWQRIFDFGSGTDQNLFLTPRAGGAGLRLVLKDALNGRNVEYQINAPALATGQWVHLAVVMKYGAMTLYRNGQAVGSLFGLKHSPADFPATNNYIGKSQYSDPLFNGRVDDFRVYSQALDGAEIWSLWGRSANSAPVFNSATPTLTDAAVGQPYTGQSLASQVTDADHDPLTFAKLTGSAWLAVAPDGTLSGTPGNGDFGTNLFNVRVTDPAGASSDAVVRLPVVLISNGLSLSSGTPNVLDGVQNLNFSTSDATNTQVQYNESDYLAGDNGSALGQTFTTGSNADGYHLSSISVRQVSWGTTWWDYTGGTVTLQVFRIDSNNGGGVLGISQLALETATVGGEDDGIGPSSGGPGDNAQWLTFNLSSGLKLEPNTMYGFQIVASGTGGNDQFFLQFDGTSTNSYAGGFAIGTGKVGGQPNSGLVFDGNNGQPSDRAFVATMTKLPSPADDYANWIGGFFPTETNPQVVGFEADPDGDGIQNGLENYFGTHPGNPNSGITQIAKSGSTFTFQHPQNASPASDVAAAYRWTLDLVDWNADGATDSGTTVTFSVSPDTPSAGTTTVTATIAGTLPVAFFADLRVTQHP